MQPVGVRFRPLRGKVVPLGEADGSARVDDVGPKENGAQVVSADAAANTGKPAGTESGRPVAVIGGPHGGQALLSVARQPAVVEGRLVAPSPQAKLLGGLRLLVPEALEEVPSKYPMPKRSKRHGRRP